MERARHISVVRRAGQLQVLVDGEDLAALLPCDSHVVVSVHPDEHPTVTLTLMADRIDVVDALSEDQEETSP